MKLVKYDEYLNYEKPGDSGYVTLDGQNLRLVTSSGKFRDLSYLPSQAYVYLFGHSVRDIHYTISQFGSASVSAYDACRAIRVFERALGSIKNPNEFDELASLGDYVVAFRILTAHREAIKAQSNENVEFVRAVSEHRKAWMALGGAQVTTRSAVREIARRRGWELCQINPDCFDRIEFRDGKLTYLLILGDLSPGVRVWVRTNGSETQAELRALCVRDEENVAIFESARLPLISDSVRQLLQSAALLD